MSRRPRDPEAGAARDRMTIRLTAPQRAKVARLAADLGVAPAHAVVLAIEAFAAARAGGPVPPPPRREAPRAPEAPSPPPEAPAAPPRAPAAPADPFAAILAGLR